MNRTKFRKALSQLDLSQARAGELVGRDARTARRWAATGLPPEAAIVFQLLLDGKITMADVEDARERANRGR